MESFTLIQALLVGLWAAFCFGGQVWGIYTNRAIVIAFGVGLILGNFEKAVMFGAIAELAFMGFGVGPGGSTPPNPLGPGIVGTIMIISLPDLTPEKALALSYPFAILVPLMITLVYTINANSYSLSKRLIEQGKYKAFKLVANLTLIQFMLGAFLLGFIAVLSTSGLQSFVKIIPQFIMDGLQVIGGLLPAIGFALIMSTMFKKEYVAALILGYVCTAYLQIPVIGLALVGAVLAFNNFYGKKSNTMANNSNNNGDIEDGI